MRFAGEAARRAARGSMTDKEVTQRAAAAKVAADVGSTGSSFTAYLEECLPSSNKQLGARSAARPAPSPHVY